MPKGKRAGKVKDKWREKRWITVLASPSFDRTPIAYIPITNDELAIGRVVETTLFDIARQDPQQNMLIKLRFQISKVEGSIASTILKGYEYSREYLRSLIRRGASMVNFIKDYVTKDGAIVRVYVVAFTVGRINSSRKHEIRLAADKVISSRASNATYEQFAQETVSQSISRELYENTKNIAKIRHIGVRKVKLVKLGEGGGEKVLPPVVSGEGEEQEEEEVGEVGESANEAEVERPKGAPPAPQPAVPLQST
jgi:small subunit ribosomal protein S3Ae